MRRETSEKDQHTGPTSQVESEPPSQRARIVFVWLGLLVLVLALARLGTAPLVRSLTAPPPCRLDCLAFDAQHPHALPTARCTFYSLASITPPSPSVAIITTTNPARITRHTHTDTHSASFGTKQLQTCLLQPLAMPPIRARLSASSSRL